MHKLKRIILYVFSFGIIFIASLVVVARIYQERIIKYVITKVNESLTSKILIEQIDFTLLRNFPRGTVVFTNVAALPSLDPKENDNATMNDTLFYFNKFEVEFNIFDLVTGNYRVKKVSASNGQVNLYINKKSQNNYTFWKSDSLSEAKDYDLQSVELSNIAINFVNEVKLFSFYSTVSKGKLILKSKKKALALQCDVELQLDSFKLQNIKYIQNQKIKGMVDATLKDGRYEIPKSSIESMGLAFLFAGFYDSNTNEINFTINGDNLNVSNVLNIIPKEMYPEASRFRGTGKASFVTTISGKLTQSLSPHIESNFMLKDGTLSKRGTSLVVSQLNFKGNFTNGKGNSPSSSILSIEEVGFRLGKNFVNGNFLIRNFKTPYVESSFSATLDLKEFNDFFNIPGFTSMSGLFQTNLQVSGRINGFHGFHSKYFSELHPEGEIIFKNVAFVLTNKAFEYENISGKATIKETIDLSNLNFAINKNDFHINGTVSNGWQYLWNSKEYPVSMDLQIYSRFQELDNYYPVSRSKNETGVTHITFPDNVYLNLKFNLDSIRFRKFKAGKTFGNLHYKPGMITVNSLSFNTMSGSITGGGILLQDVNQDIVVQCQSQLKNINISELFYQTNNFGQTFVNSTHLKGKLSGNAHLESIWSNTLDAYTDKIVAQTDIIVENGELIGFDPLLSLSKYIDVDELSHVYFKTLKNKIYIKDRIVNIPKMEIQSSAFNIDASGRHDFDNNIDYRLKILISDLLKKKSKKINKDSEFGAVEEDGLGRTGLFLKIVGNTNDYKVSWDKEMVKTHINESFKEEKKTIRSLFRDEFGNKNKRSTQNEVDEETISKNSDKGKPRSEESVKKKPAFKISWDDESVDTSRIH